MTLTVVVPTYNESQNIKLFVEAVLSELSKLNYEGVLLIADDNSPDGTSELVKTLQSTYKNLYLVTGKKDGLGAAYNRALKYAFETLKSDVVVTMDADFSHDPADIAGLVAAVESGADFAVGSRYITGGGIPADWAWYRKLLSSAGNVLVRFLFGTWAIHEYTTAFRAFTRSLWEKLPKSKLAFSDNTFLPAFIYEASQNQAKIVEVPTKFKDRVAGESKIEIGNYAPNLLKYALGVFINRIFKL